MATAVINNPENKKLTLEDALKYINDSVEDFHECTLIGPSMKGIYNDFPMHKVAIWGNIDLAQVLLDNGADINSIGEDNDTPLHRAIAGRKLTMIKFLLSNGADVTLKNIYGSTVIDDALISNDKNIIGLFASYGVQQKN